MVEQVRGKPDASAGGPYKPNQELAHPTVGTQTRVASMPTEQMEEKRSSWSRLVADVTGARASVQPLAGWLLTGLFCFVVYLTVVYAPGAFERSRQAEGTDPGGVISLTMGYWTIALVSAAAMIVGFEPHFRRLLAGSSAPHGSQSWVQQGASYIWRFPSVVLSFLDLILARLVASMIGATLQPAILRYLSGGAVISIALLVGLVAPPPIGLTAVVIGIVAIIAVVRRWSWIEADRDTFLVERGAARQGALRIGFSQDLRDEALLGIVFLFALIPVLLRQMQLWTCASGACAFVLDGGELPADLPGQFIAWLGYFGAELAKSVPFVDWSEVFQVANSSPIKPRTTFGAQVVFVMRAALDLLLLAAVVQAVGIANRLREQDIAFRSNRLPILEPFAEARELRLAAQRNEDGIDIRPVDQQSYVSFPNYDEERLQVVASQADGSNDPLIRIAAIAVLSCQYPKKSTYEFFNQLARPALHTKSSDVKSFVERVAGGARGERTSAELESSRPRCLELVRDQHAPLSIRCTAARQLGRMQAHESTNMLLNDCLSRTREDIRFLAVSAVALSKTTSKLTLNRQLIEALGTRADRSLNLAALQIAYAIARSEQQLAPTEVAEQFPESFRDLAHYGAALQPTAISGLDAIRTDLDLHSNQLVRLDPRELSHEFRMGSLKTEPEAFDQDTPEVTMSLAHAYAIGRFAVTRAEYVMFADATGRKWYPSFGGRSDLGRFPVTDVDWFDATAYCNWLELITGDVYRLPNEVEWEYACRAGTRTRYWWGDDWDVSKAHTNASGGTQSPVNVDQYAPNPWGLWSMTGNVFEWCADPWHEGHEGRPTSSRHVWVEGADFSHRAVRGGSWLQAPRYARSAARRARKIDDKDHYIGFRVAMTLPER